MKYKSGDKVVPFQKTYWGNLDKSIVWERAQRSGQPFLYVRDFDENEGNGVYILTDNTKDYGGDYFYEDDFVPYIEKTEVKTPETVVKKYIYDSGHCYGEVGKKVEGTNYHIGDIVAWHWTKDSSCDDDFEHKLDIIVDCTPDYPEHPFVMGLGVYDITKDSYKSNFAIDEIIIPYDQVNDKHLKYVINNNFEIREIEEIILPKLTLAEVKEIVGYDFDLVE